MLLCWSVRQGRAVPPKVHRLDVTAALAGDLREHAGGLGRREDPLDRSVPLAHFDLALPDQLGLPTLLRRDRHTPRAEQGVTEPTPAGPLRFDVVPYSLLLRRQRHR